MAILDPKRLTVNPPTRRPLRSLVPALLILLLFSSLLAAACVAVSGIIAFVGLVVPHIARHIVGPDHRRLLPAAALVGAVLLAAADVAARLILPGSEVPIGIVTTLLGCPFFVYLLWRSKRSAY